MSVPFQLISQYFDGQLSQHEFDKLVVWINASSHNARTMARIAAMHCHIGDTLEEITLTENLDQMVECSVESAWDEIEPDSFLAEVFELQLAKQKQINEESARLRAMFEQQQAARANKQTQTKRASKESNESKGGRVLLDIAGVQVYRSSSEYSSGGLKVKWIGWAVAAIIMVAFVMNHWQNNQPSDQQLSVNNQSHGIYNLGPVAKLTNATLASWEENIEIGDVLNGGHYYLTQGFAEVTFSRGAKVILQAPCRVTLKTDNTMRIKSGRMVAHINDSSKGFTVQTPVSRVVDFGTEFGVDVQLNGQTDVAVFQGEVELAAGDSEEPTGEKQLLQVDQRARVKKGSQHIEALSDASQVAFIRQLPDPPYIEIVRKDQPLTYWRFEEDKESMICVGRGKLSIIGQLNGGADIVDKGALRGLNQKSLQLDKNAYVVMPSNDTLSGLTANFTIEAWVKPAVHSSTRMRVISTRGSNDGGFGLGVTKRHPNVSNDLWQPMFTFFGTLDYFANVDISSTTWTHLVVSITNDGRVSMFIDGRPVGLSRRTPTGSSNNVLVDERRLGSPSLEPLTIGRNPLASPREIEQWHGRIDEMAIYDRALSADEIDAHYRVAVRER